MVQSVDQNGSLIPVSSQHLCPVWCSGLAE